ncbi:hypothetical protein [Neisseria musculi]|uniref:hypothetical protein n=1 Tax=Neisseria musculi TaxID=1815583 RepID=UPI00164C1192|nr:hypothetical protein [Neisseria musculi]
MKIPAIWKYRPSEKLSDGLRFPRQGFGAAAAENFGLPRFAQDFLQGNAVV